MRFSLASDLATREGRFGMRSRSGYVRAGGFERIRSDSVLSSKPTVGLEPMQPLVS